MGVAFNFQSDKGQKEAKADDPRRWKVLFVKAFTLLASSLSENGCRAMDEP